MRWTPGEVDPTTIGAASTKVLLASFTNTIGIDQTVLRIRGNLHVASDQLLASEVMVGVFGMIMVTEDAFSAGAASVPGPISDGDADWILWHPFTVRQFFASAIGFDTPAGQEYVLDTKAKRIFEGGGTKRLAVVGETSSNSQGLVISAQFRLLSQIRGTR